MEQPYRLVPLGEESYKDFISFHESECEYGPCYCMYWWVDRNEWDDLSGEDTLMLRNKLHENGVSDGYLLYQGDVVVAWCQCHPRDEFPKLAEQFSLLPQNGVWAITCFLVKKDMRHSGVMVAMLDFVLEAVKHEGATAVEAYPRRLMSFDELYAWNGVEQTFVNKGFTYVKAVEGRCVYRYDF